VKPIEIKDRMTMKKLVIKYSPVTLAIIFLAVFSVGTVSGINQDIAKLNRFVQSQKVNTASMQIFREGRDSSRPRTGRKPRRNSTTSSKVIRRTETSTPRSTGTHTLCRSRA
jgi:hypothetical protein